MNPKTTFEHRATQIPFIHYKVELHDAGEKGAYCTYTYLDYPLLIK